MGTDLPSRRWVIALGCLAGVAGSAMAFVVIAAGVVELGAGWAKLRYPGDPSAGDSVGWGLVFLAPVLVPLDLVASIAVGVVVFSRVTRRR